MTCATFGKSCELASCCTNDATTRTSYGDRCMVWAGPTTPDLTYSAARALTRFAKMLSADAEGSTLKVPGAIRPSSRRWSLPNSVTGSIAQAGTDNTAGALLLAAARRSSTDTQRLL